MKKEVTLSQINKAEKALLNVDQMNVLLMKTPESHVYERPGKGGQKWRYVTGAYVKKVLNLAFGYDWDFEIIEDKISLEYKQVIVKGRLTVRVDGKPIVKMQYGRQDVKFKRDATNIPLDLGNDLKGAATDALKKCASELGVASDIYAPEEFKEIQVQQDEDGRPEVGKVDLALGLLDTSSYEGDAVEVLAAKIKEATSDELTNIIVDLQQNQVDPIEAGHNYNQGVIKDKI